MRLIESTDATLDPIAPGISRVKGFFPGSIVALQTNRQGGVSFGPFESFNLGGHVGDDPGAVAANRARLLGVCAGLDARSDGHVWLNQVHGTTVYSGGPISTHSAADAKVTGTTGEICAVMTADCLPLLIARPSTGHIAAVHAGWRGLCDGVIEACLDSMLQLGGAESGSNDIEFTEDEWFVWLGPAIGVESFEVGHEVRQAFVDRDPVAIAAFHPSPKNPQKWMADLGLLARQRIQAWPGDFVARIAQENDCVLKNAAQYFSYRRCSKNGQPTGRMASLIYRVGN